MTGKRCSDPIACGPPGSTMMNIANRCFTLVFILCAAVQLNDPDGVIWVVIYGAPIVLCVCHELGRVPRLAAWGLCALASIGSVFLLLSALDAGPVGLDALRWTMLDSTTERLRESGGLLLVGLWSAILAKHSA